MNYLFLAVILAVVSSVQSFMLSSTSKFSSSTGTRSRLNMVTQFGPYVPDGLTKAQYEAIRMKEQNDLKSKGNLGAVGIQKFKSRSMQAFQEAKENGIAKHMFPVNTKTTPIEERPYMMRKGGDWEGIDLKAKGLQGKKQGAANPRLPTDDVYDRLKAAGKL
jgi:hypothetical protein